jgi:hypothetical protein
MSAFYHAVTGHQYFVSFMRQERCGVISDSKRYSWGLNAFLLEEFMDPVN